MEHKKYWTILSLLVLGLTVTSCGLFQQKTVTVYEEVPTYIETQVRPEPIETLPVQIHTVSEANLDEFIETHRSKYGSVVFVALDIRDYENMAYNLAVIQRYVKDLIALENYYEEQVKPEEASK